MDLSFDGELWIWDARRQDTWTFVSLPADLSEELSEQAPPGRGFGSIRVSVTLGTSNWQTSVFPDSKSGCYVLPIKKAVRRREGIDAGDTVRISLRTE